MIREETLVPCYVGEATELRLYPCMEHPRRTQRSSSLIQDVSYPGSDGKHMARKARRSERKNPSHENTCIHGW